MFDNFFLIMPFVRLCVKYCRAVQAADDNMPHVHCMLDT